MHFGNQYTVYLEDLNPLVVLLIYAHRQLVRTPRPGLHFPKSYVIRSSSSIDKHKRRWMYALRAITVGTVLYQ